MDEPAEYQGARGLGTSAASRKEAKNELRQTDRFERSPLQDDSCIHNHSKAGACALSSLIMCLPAPFMVAYTERLYGRRRGVPADVAEGSKETTADLRQPPASMLPNAIRIH